ncbi:MAG: hypothetical protein GY694_11465 [Gammaproteobacteria bacterium]|nr:hypothetical protein [Gammaproteobacteria bacterium]
MSNNKNFKFFWLSAIADAVVMIVLLIFWVVATSYSGDTSTAFGFVFLAGFIFVSLPLFCLIVAQLFIIFYQFTLQKIKWLIFYFALSFIGHLLLAYHGGFFDKAINEYQQYKLINKNPAQAKLQYAINLGPTSDIKKVISALAAGADPNKSFNQFPIPPLVLAASRADAPVISALLDAGANPNIRASTEFGLSFYIKVKNPSPLDLVTFSEHNNISDSLKILLSSGADPSQTILKLGACRKGDIELYAWADKLKANGKVDARNNTCLHHAAETGQAVFLEKLLFNPSYQQEKESLIASNKSSQYPLDVAIKKKHYKAAIIIVRAGGTANQKWTLTEIFKQQSNNPLIQELINLLNGSKG